jgi:hypothetical protein
MRKSTNSQMQYLGENRELSQQGSAMESLQL